MQDGDFAQPEGGMEAGPDAEKPDVTNEFGIEETIDLVDSLVKLANAVKVSMADGKFSALDAFNFTGAVVSLPSALTGLNMVPAELSNLDDEEIQTIVNVVRDTLEYATDETIQLIIQKALVVGLGIKDIVELIKDA